MHNQLTGAGIAKEAVDAYLAGRAKYRIDSANSKLI